MSDFTVEVRIAKYISILVREDLIYRIIQSGFSHPIMYHVIEESPYDRLSDFEKYYLDIEGVSHLTGLTTGSLLGLLKETTLP